jgi:hypothetical protein
MVQGPAYTRSARWLALAAVLAVGWQAAQAWASLDSRPDGLTLTLLGLGGLGLLHGLAQIWLSRTEVDDRFIRQYGWLPSQVEIARLTQVKLIYVPRLSWLIAPRLVVRSGGVRSWVFHAASAEVLQRFWQLAHDAQLPPSMQTPPSAP